MSEHIIATNQKEYNAALQKAIDSSLISSDSDEINRKEEKKYNSFIMQAIEESKLASQFGDIPNQPCFVDECTNNGTISVDGLWFSCIECNDIYNKSLHIHKAYTAAHKANRRMLRKEGRLAVEKAVDNALLPGPRIFQ
jgi:hypothetical protein